MTADPNTPVAAPHQPRFVHLRLHSEYSITDGIVQLDQAIAAAADDGMPALGVSDLANLFGMVKFYKGARGRGIKPIVGVDAWIRNEAERDKPHRVLLICRNRAGYGQLCELLTRAYLENKHRGRAEMRREWFEGGAASALLCLSGAMSGDIGAAIAAGNLALAEQLAADWARLFPGAFYIELQRAGHPGTEGYIRHAVDIAGRLGLPVVATHPVQFLKREDFKAHEARVCIAQGYVLADKRRPRDFTEEQYLKSQAEMCALFADLPEALENAVEIARRCSLTVQLGKNFLPLFPTPEGMTLDDFLVEEAKKGLEERLVQLYPHPEERERQRPRYEQRLKFETDTIIQMGFPGYFLIVADFIQWGKNNGVPVGPGRGSGAGSLVAYSLKITDIDPLEYALLFERFLNPERVSMPDFDIDFCQDNRYRVIEYVRERYGKDAVSQIATFGTMAARAAIRDVGRVLDMSYTFCDGISKLIPNKPGQHITIDGALKVEPLLAERLAKEDEVKTLLALAQKLEGLTRNVGMHAGGVLIAPGKLTDFCPLYQQPGSESAVSQYDKDDVEAIGLVKFDFLGLATLTILEIAREFIMQRHKGQQNFAYEDIALDDAKTYRLFQDGKTEAVFQFESRGMQGMLRDAKPTRLEDLIALNALYRPGPMDLIPIFVARKHGREEVEYPHPAVADMLSETYGIMVYQEQVMQTAQILGGYSLGGADLLRRAMGKKKAEEMAEHREKFRAGALATHGIPQDKADEIFDLMEKFAGYGFNKSHAAAYSLLAYHTGWLKVHYTAEFYCANMTVEMDNTDKLKVLYEDAVKHFGISFEPPDVNRGHHRFEPVSDSVIRYGLGAVKGTGQLAIEAIVKAREEGGAFKSLFDFCARVDRQRINKRTVEALIKAGAFDSLNPDRAALAASLDRAFDYAAAQEANANQGGLFDMFGDDAHGSSAEEPALVEVTPWGVKERLTHEKTAIGFYLSGHLFDEVAREVRLFAKRQIDDLIDSREPQTIAGIVSGLRMINGQRGRLALFVLDDKSATIEVVADEAVYTAARDTLREDELVILSGRLQPGRGGFEPRFVAQQISGLAEARCRYGKYLRVAINGKLPDIARMVREFAPRREHTEAGEVQVGLPVRLALVRAGAQVELQLGEAACFFPADAALASWTAQADAGQAAIVYE